MINYLKNLLGIFRQVFSIFESVKISGSIIPSSKSRLCGPNFKDDNFYLKSAEREANRLIENFQCNKNNRILDIGCGQGRLPIGILRKIGEIDYIGIDIDKKSINWCQRYIEQLHPSFKFKHLNLYNDRYNRQGIKFDDSFQFDFEPKIFDIIYLYSVFSHMTLEDMKIYLKEFSRILSDEGKIFFTTFVEDNVPNVSINPEKYHLKCDGPLHIVRYKKDYLFSLIHDYGFNILKFTHQTEADNQSAIYLSKKIVEN